MFQFRVNRMESRNLSGASQHSQKLHNLFRCCFRSSGYCCFVEGKLDHLTETIMSLVRMFLESMHTTQ